MRRMCYLSILIALVFVAGCGLPIGQGTVPPHSTVDPNLPTSLHVTSHSVTYQLDKTITDSLAVQRLYNAIYALPRQGFPVSCTVVYGHKFTLMFLRGARIVAQMLYISKDCQLVYVSQADVRYGGANGFRSLFGETLGISMPLTPPSQETPTPALRQNNWDFVAAWSAELGANRLPWDTSQSYHAGVSSTKGGHSWPPFVLLTHIIPL